MKVHFCDLCNESVPQADLDLGRAVMLKGRVICVNCDHAMSNAAKAGGEQHAHSAAARGVPPAHSGIMSTSPGRDASSSVLGGANASSESPVSTPMSSGGQGGGALPADTHDGTRWASSIAPPTSVTPPVAAAPSGPRSSVGLWVAVLGLLFTAGAIWVFNERLQRLDESDRALATRIDSGAQKIAGLETLPKQFAAELVRQESTGRRDLALERDRTQQEINALTAKWASAREESARLSAELETLRKEGASGLSTWQQRVEDVSQRVARQEDDVKHQSERIATLEESVANPAPPTLVANGNGGPAPKAPAAWKSLVADLSDPVAGVRWIAVDSLGRSGDPETVPYLVPLLKDSDVFVRMGVARGLGDLRAEKAIPALIDALEDPESSVRETANVSLLAITGQDLFNKFDARANEAERAKRLRAIRDWWKRVEDDGGFKKNAPAGN